MPQVVYSDSLHHADPTAFSKSWHTYVSLELQPPSVTSLKMLTCPEAGGDTLWSSGYALYSSLSPGFQAYLEGLTAVHNTFEQSREMGQHVRREPIETTHPVVSVHPVTSWKSIYVNPGGCTPSFHAPRTSDRATFHVVNGLRKF